MSIRIGNNIIANNFQMEPINPATTTEAGIIRIATDAEVKAGTSKTIAITPYQLATAASKTQVDDETITKDSNDVITAIGLKSKNDILMYNWIGTLEEYKRDTELAIIQPDWVCYVTDDYVDGDIVEVTASTDCVQVHSPLVDISSGNHTIQLSRGISIHRFNIIGNASFTFNTSELNLTDNESYTFEMKLVMPQVHSLNFPANILWMDNNIPLINEPGVYYVVFRTDDQGTKWYANLQGKWS